MVDSAPSKLGGQVEMLMHTLDRAVDFLAGLAPPGSFQSSPQWMRGFIAVLLVCLVCGAVGSMVVGNRMAFFSDALAHCAFAGVALGLLVAVLTGAHREDPFYQWGIPVIMVGFGVVVGLAIAFVREKTALASDTVIGVFFAGAIGFGAMILKALNQRTYLSPESFLFGDPNLVNVEDLFILIVLAVVTLVILIRIYNHLVFTSFNASLARSRQIPVRFYNYLFIVLLAVIVNLSLKTVGALLINGLLIVPAASASNLSRNLRQLFALSIGLSLLVGVVGSWLSTIGMPDPAGGKPIHFGWGGTIVVVSVLLFFISMPLGRWVKGRDTA